MVYCGNFDDERLSEVAVQRLSGLQDAYQGGVRGGDVESAGG